jgi:hypothetical protein
MARQVEKVLEAAGLCWSRRDFGWAVPVSGAGRELLLKPTPGGLHIEAVLLELENAVPVSQHAVRRFLEHARKLLSPAHGELKDNQALLAVDIPAARIETQLNESIRSVSDGYRALAREARTLLVPELARYYLAFHENSE